MRLETSASDCFIANGESAPAPAALAVHGLTIAVDETTIVANVDLSINRGETLCLVGESGCGKSLTCLALMGLLPRNASILSGTIECAGKSYVLADLVSPKRRPPSGMAMIYQDATSSLNPLMTIGAQIAEPLRVGQGRTKRDAKAETLALLRRVGIPDPARRFFAYPHELSGGTNQRVAIAMALACQPMLLVADEPTTALDVTVQAQILALLRDIEKATDLALLLVTHDFGVVAEIADHVAVMYAGRVVERRPAADLFDTPAHPYTAALLECQPVLNPTSGLRAIPGAVPARLEQERGCAFAPRCSRARKICMETTPPSQIIKTGGLIACFFPLIELC